MKSEKQDGLIDKNSKSYSHNIIVAVTTHTKALTTL